MIENKAYTSQMHLLGKFSGINVYMSVGGLLPNPPTPPIYDTFPAPAPFPQ